MRYFTIMSLFLLFGCASFDNVIYAGMRKPDFLGDMARNEMSWQPVYYDPETRIEVVISKNNIFNDSNVGIAVVFEDVSFPYHVWWPMQGKRVPPGCNERLNVCSRYAGDGIVRGWYHENEVAVKALEGDPDATLLAAIFQLIRESHEDEINQIAFNNSLSREAAEKKYVKKVRHEYWDYEDIALEQWYENIDIERASKVAASNVITEPRKRKIRTSSASNSILEDLIDVAIELYVNKTLGLDHDHSLISANDLSKIEEASRRGTRKAIRKQARMKQIHKNLSTPPPINSN